MSKEADEVTRLVEQYEERVSTDPDAGAVRALLQGMLMGTAMKSMQKGPINIVEVEVDKDDEGVYEHHFVVHMASGVRLRVSVEVEK